MEHFRNFLYLVECRALQNFYWGLDIAFANAEQCGDQALMRYFDKRADHFHNKFRDLADRYLKDTQLGEIYG